ncbi:Alpha/beta hydrolase [Forsythia ovata]|uniref:Alpha/beta hydrolase n=1 Tax=Forsythia ovata TaxID=205694 RepID=A0ABD1VJG3_9LAMI
MEVVRQHRFGRLMAVPIGTAVSHEVATARGEFRSGPRPSPILHPMSAAPTLQYVEMTGLTALPSRLDYGCSGTTCCRSVPRHSSGNSSCNFNSTREDITYTAGRFVFSFAFPEDCLRRFIHDIKYCQIGLDFQVLNALGQGETLMKALQDVVPEDVREKLTTVVSGILQSQMSNLKFERLLSLGNIFDVAAGLNSKVLEKNRLSKEGGGDDHSSDQRKKINQLGDGSGKVYSSDKPLVVLES